MAAGTDFPRLPVLAAARSLLGGGHRRQQLGGFDQQVLAVQWPSGSPAGPADIRRLQLRRGARLLEEQAAGRPTLMEM